MPQEMFFEFEGVSRTFTVRGGRAQTFHALAPLTCGFRRGVSCALVGESGSGKTTLARLLTGLLSPSSGRIRIEGQPQEQALHDRRRPYARRVQMVFQNPYLSLDPKWNIRSILEEGLFYLSAAERHSRACRVLEQVGLPAHYASRRPSALSGGERQRVAIARALAVEPDFLILDEPTSQLDVSVQAQILTLIQSLKPVLQGGILWITHDLALAARVAEVLLVLREGKLVEAGPCLEVLGHPRETYTRQLLASIPVWPPRGGGQ